MTVRDALIILTAATLGLIVIVVFYPSTERTVCNESVAILDPSSLPPVRAPVRTAWEGYERYRNESFRFSLFYPKEMVVQEFPEASGGMTVTFQNPETLHGFQIFIIPYAHNAVTEERFSTDIRTGVFEATSTVPLDGICATAFLSRSVIIGDTREVWAVHNGYLYEITTFRRYERLMEDIIDSWRFL